SGNKRPPRGRCDLRGDGRFTAVEGSVTESGRPLLRLWAPGETGGRLRAPADPAFGEPGRPPAAPKGSAPMAVARDGRRGERGTEGRGLGAPRPAPALHVHAAGSAGERRQRCQRESGASTRPDGGDLTAETPGPRLNTCGRLRGERRRSPGGHAARPVVCGAYALIPSAPALNGGSPRTRRRSAP